MVEARASSDGEVSYKIGIRCGVAMPDGSRCRKDTNRQRVGDGQVQMFCPDHGLIATLNRNPVDDPGGPTQTEVSIRCGAPMPDGSRCGKNPDPRPRPDGRVRLVCPDHGLVAVVGKITALNGAPPA